MKPTRFYSKRQETSVARQVGGKRVANSGATPFHKGDVETNDFLIECKTVTGTKHKSFSIREEWLLKNREEAIGMGKHHSALAFQFGVDEPNYYIIDERQFMEYLFLLKEVCESDS